MGARGISVIVAELDAAVAKRAAMIRSGENCSASRSARGKQASST